MSHSSIFLLSSSSTSRSSLEISYHPTLRVLLSNDLSHGHICASTSSRSGLFVFPHTKSQFQHFCEAHGDVLNTVSFLSPFSAPRISPSVSPISPCFLALQSLCPISVLSFASVLYPPNLSTDIISSWVPPVSFHAFSITLSHHSPARPFSTFFPYSSISYGWRPLF